MFEVIKRVGLRLVIAACGRRHQRVGSGYGFRRRRRRPRDNRSPNPDTPRRTERIRFVDIKHIKAELTVDAQEARRFTASVTHTLEPIAPLSHTARARLRTEAQGEQGHRRRHERSLAASSRPRTKSCRSRSIKPMGPTTPSTWRSVLGLARSRALLRLARAAYPEKTPRRSGPRARRKTRTTGFRATTIPTSAPPAR